MFTANTNDPDNWTCSEHRTAHHAVFVSYRQNDHDSRTAELFHSRTELKLRERYPGKQLPVFFDKYCLPLGGDWTTGFVNGLQKSRVIVYLLSQQSLDAMKEKLEINQRDNVLVEIEEGLKLASIAGTAVTLIPVLIGRYDQANPLQLIKLAPFAEFDQSALVHSHSGVLVKDTLRRLFQLLAKDMDPKNVAATVDQVIDEIDRLGVPHSIDSWMQPQNKNINVIGSQHELFSRPNPEVCINRDDIISQIDTAFRASSAKSLLALLKGVGGSGKTFIATKYGYQCVDRGYQVAWLKADSVDTVKESYIVYAQWILRHKTIPQLPTW
ncbi:hypothetical protein BJ742DRAFT_785222 [Cladochytrium replicatum]|nr:hypothetical protein BJ742DRAFT_785222 [Cladochytrium replicatum]